MKCLLIIIITTKKSTPRTTHLLQMATSHGWFAIDGIQVKKSFLHRFKRYSIIFNLIFFCFLLFFFSQWSKKDLLNNECGSPLHLHLKLEASPITYSIPLWNHLQETYVKNWNLWDDKARLIGLGRRLENTRLKKWVFFFLVFFFFSIFIIMNLWSSELRFYFVLLGLYVMAWTGNL